MKISFRSERDMANDIRRVIDEEIEGSGPTWSSGSVAIRVVERLQREDPELLTKWLNLLAVQIIRTEITAIAKELRSEAKRITESKGGSIFSAAVSKYEGGDKTALGAWLNTIYIVNNENQRRRLRDMDAEDLLFAATDYTNRAQVNAMQAAFLRAIANRLGGARTVGDVFSDEELTKLWRSLS
jgi:hypothetical protein